MSGATAGLGPGPSPTKLHSLSSYFQHVLPKGFHKVRYFGLWHPSRRSQATRVRHALRLDRPIGIVAQGFSLPRRPAGEEILDGRYMPPAELRRLR